MHAMARGGARELGLRCAPTPVESRLRARPAAARAVRLGSPFGPRPPSSETRMRPRSEGVFVTCQVEAPKMRMRPSCAANSRLSGNWSESNIRPARAEALSTDAPARVWRSYPTPARYRPCGGRRDPRLGTRPRPRSKRARTDRTERRPRADLEHRPHQHPVHVAHERVGLDPELQQAVGSGLRSRTRQHVALEAHVVGLGRRERGEVVGADQQLGAALAAAGGRAGAASAAPAALEGAARAPRAAPGSSRPGWWRRAARRSPAGAATHSSTATSSGSSALSDVEPRAGSPS